MMRPHPEDAMPREQARTYLVAQLAAADAAAREAREALVPLEIARNEALLNLLNWEARQEILDNIASS
jgi:hypothetical protein